MGTLNTIFLFGIVLLIPVLGFILMLGYARKGETVREQRWRKSHGLLFWVMIPTVAGLVTVLGARGILPSIFSLGGIVVLALSTSMSMYLQRRREEEI